MKCLLVLPLVVLAGCEWGIPAFEAEKVPFVGVSREFREVTGNELGAGHAYVVGISEEKMAARDVDGAVKASLRGETVPSGRPLVVVRNAGLRQQSEAVTEQAMAADPTGSRLATGTGTTGATGSGSNRGMTESEGREPEARPSQEKLPTSEPATSVTADLNGDGFVTLDEIVAMHRVHVPSEEIARRLTATGYRLYATRTQLDHLAAFGVEPAAVQPLRMDPVSLRPKRAETEMR